MAVSISTVADHRIKLARNSIETGHNAAMAVLYGKFSLREVANHYQRLCAEQIASEFDPADSPIAVDQFVALVNDALAARGITWRLTKAEASS